jgi:hypothetical protein
VQQKLYAEARVAAKDARDKADAMPEGPAKTRPCQGRRIQEKSDAIRSEVNRIQNEGRRVTYAEVITTGQKKLFEKVTGKPYQTVAMTTKGGAEAAPAMMAGGDSMMMMASGVRTEKINIPGYDRKELTKEEKEAVSEKARAAYAEEAEFFGIPEGKERKKSYISTREQIAATLCVPPKSKAQLLAVITCASSARATARPSKTPTTTPACPRRSR